MAFTKERNTLAWHHFTLMSCDPDYTVTEINSDVEWQTHPCDIWFAESECHLQMKITLNTNKPIRISTTART